MQLSLDDWHARYTQQARWTRDLRRYLYGRVGIESAQRVLEIGCGTGAILSELHDYTQGRVFGLDVDPGRLRLATRYAPGAVYTVADAHDIPFTSGSFDLSFCHFLLLWVADAEQVVAEMVRVTRPGHYVLAMAEPDYGGRIDYPESLSKLGDLQQSALRQQGADPHTGRRLSAHFIRAGLEAVESGVLGGQWSGRSSQEDWESEWQVLEADLTQTSAVLHGEAANVDLAKLKQLDFDAWKRGERVLYVPTFYALGRLPV